MQLSEGGKVVLSCWNEIPIHYPKIKLHPFIIMPNHIHGILEITGSTKGTENPQYDDLLVIIPHAGIPDGGVQNFEPLQEDQSHGESDDSCQYFEPLQHDLLHGESKDAPEYFEPLQDFPLHGESDELIQNIESMPNGHQRKQGSIKSGSVKLINEYQHIIPGSIGSIVRGFEIGVTKWFRKNTEIHTVWQRNFYEKIIRSPKAYKNISNYIINNPKNWDKDEFNETKSK